MSIRRARRLALLLCTIALLVAGCSGGGSDSSSGSPAPRGIAGVSGGNGQHGKHHRQKAKVDKRSHHRRGASTSTSTSANAPRSSTAPARRQSSTAPAPGTTSASRSSTSSRPKPPPSGPTVTVTPHTGLHDGQTVTVEGWHFTPNMTLAVAECHDRGTETNLSDCNINNVLTYAPGRKVKSDANGHVGPLQIVVAKTFKSVNCGTQKCLVAISEPALNPDPADEGDQYIKFG